MRVLFVTPRFPGVGLRGDQMRSFQQIRHLAARHRIVLVAGARPDAGLRDHVGRHDWCERIEVVPARWLPRLLSLVAALASGRPLQTALYERWLPRTTLARLAGEGHELVHLQMARLGGLLPAWHPLPCVVDLVDALSLNMRRRAGLEHGLLARLADREAGALALLEQQVCAQASAIAVSAADDAAALPPARRCALVPNGVDPERFPFRAGRSGHTLLLAGNLGYFPNVDAACWFAEQVLPRVRRALPAARLRLVGATPARRLRALARDNPAIELVGPVVDMAVELHAAALAVCPLRAGSGQQLKLLEAMACGTPVVSLQRPAAAIDALDGEQLRRVDDAAAMAAAIVDLLQAPAAATAMAVRARDHVLARYTWARAAETLDALWREAAQMATAG